MTKISIVIPHKGRDSLLLWHLKELQKQVFEDFEVIVILDEPVPETGMRWSDIHLSLRELENINLPIDVIFSGGGGPNGRTLGTLSSFFRKKLETQLNIPDPPFSFVPQSFVPVMQSELYYGIYAHQRRTNY